MNQQQNGVLEWATFYLNFMRKHNLRFPKCPPSDPKPGEEIKYDPNPFITEKEYIASIERQLQFMT